MISLSFLKLNQLQSQPREQGAPVIQFEGMKYQIIFSNLIYKSKNIVRTPESYSTLFSFYNPQGLIRLKSSIITIEQPLITEVIVQATQPKQ